MAGPAGGTDRTRHRPSPAGTHAPCHTHGAQQAWQICKPAKAIPDPPASDRPAASFPSGRPDANSHLFRAQQCVQTHRFCFSVNTNKPPCRATELRECVWDTNGEAEGCQLLSRPCVKQGCIPLTCFLPLSASILIKKYPVCHSLMNMPLNAVSKQDESVADS